MNQSDQHNELKLQVKGHRCFDCKGVMTWQNIAWREGRYMIWCNKCRREPRLERTKSLTELYKEGSVMPIELKNILDTKLDSI